MKTANTKKTLDLQHHNKLVDFQDKKGNIQKLKKELETLEHKIKHIEELKKTTELNDDEFNNYLLLIDNKHDLEKKIIAIEKTSDEVDYYVNTGSILFRYYDIVEKGMEDSTNNTAMKDKSVLKYFVSTPSNAEPDTDNTNVKLNDRATLLDKYMYYTDTNYLKNIDTNCKDFCQNCSSTNRSIVLNDGLIFCNDCNTAEYIIVDHERPSYRDPPREISYFAYKRMKYLCVKAICCLKTIMASLLISL